ncbi:cytochrome c oxidase assembly protein [Paenibacillus sp. J2TS4]|uniref:cytochrome c oxidase assembly protein n=1 Tax=Paenibacillus sp. J2TS4 TaxID=2807194 RepID=UPI001B230CCB|nr:cytochrome c oxidase assembly protein [Paenibacillus sp. J2TS4]GIP34826.1 cytochrome c oxidase assembly factor CtaG [Paenibacillus sp. J2TS4]
MPNTGHIHHQNPDFFALWRPDIFLLMVLVGIVYFYFMGPGRKLFAESEPVSGGTKALMITALGVFYIAQGTPINFYGHSFLFSSHMLQMSLIYLVFPPLFYLGLPHWFVKSIIEIKWIKPWLYRVTHPLISVIIFNALFSFYHIPTIFNYMMEYHGLHLIYHWVLMVTAFQMWFPIFVKDPKWARVNGLQKMVYMFANGVLLTPACALLIFTQVLVYDVYVGAPQTLSFLPPIDDQQMGGVVMKIMQEIVYGIVLAYSFFEWYRSERKKEEQLDLDMMEALRPMQKSEASESRDSAVLKPNQVPSS